MTVNTLSGINKDGQVFGYSFHQFEGQTPGGIRTELRRIVRPGVDGTAFWRIGDRAAPFQLQSLSDSLNVSVAQATMEGYRRVVGVDAVTLVHSSKYWSVVVLDLQEVTIRAVASSSGGFNVGPAAIIVANWTMEVVT